MDYVKEYKNFVNSRYLSEGLRITAGVTLPAAILSYFDLLPVGIVVSLGAMCVSVTDNPGPIQHRRNGMLACIFIIFFVALVTGFAAFSPFALGLLIFIFCFIFSMIGVFGARSISIGVAALLIMVLNIDHSHYGWDVIKNALYIFTGGIWYMSLSLLLYTFRPYKLVQQELGDCILATSEYLRIRASLYSKNANYENIYAQMLEQQIEVHQKQELVRDLLFKSRNIVKESTTTGRTLLMMFTDIVDLFERTMTSYYDYKTLHRYFDNTDILERYTKVIPELSAELDEIGLAVKSGTRSLENPALQKHISELREYFISFRNEHRTAENIDAFISLRHILSSIEDVGKRIKMLHLYTGYDKTLTASYSPSVEYEKFVSHEEISFYQLKDNLTFKSNTFKHALRVSLATLTGYIVSKFLPFGHSYWILLTIIVILKPAYSLTKKRNYERILGTIGGAAIGFLILYFIKDTTVLFVLMLFLMIGTYTFLRLNYMLSVIFMTPYILLLFHLIAQTNFNTIIYDRVIDTAIGSAIAFVANFLIVPAWEHEQMNSYMAAAVEDNKKYFSDVASAFICKPVSITAYKVSRKNAFVSLANLSDAFTRMLSEPKSKQKNSKYVHGFVVMNHMLTSHIATLSSYVELLAKKYCSEDFTMVMNDVIRGLNAAKAILKNEPVTASLQEEAEESLLNQRVNELLEKRREELRQGFSDTETRKTLSEFKAIVDQFNFIYKASADIEKISHDCCK